MSTITKYGNSSQNRRVDQGKQPCYRQVLPGTSGIHGSTRNAPGSPKPKILHVGLAASLFALRYIYKFLVLLILLCSSAGRASVFKAHHNGLFDSALLNACPALIRVRFLKHCYCDFKCCDANDFEAQSSRITTINTALVIMMANACLTSLQTVFSMFMVRTPNPRLFTFTRSVLWKKFR